MSLLAAVALAATQPLYLTTEQLPPAVMKQDGKIIGYSVDKVREIMKRAKVDYRIDLLLWKRAYAIAQIQANACVFATARTSERETEFKWVGPLHTVPWILYGTADNKFNIKSLDDARGLRIGAYNGDVRGEYLAKRGFKVDFIQNDDGNPRKLLIGRIDLWVSSTKYVQNELQKNGWVGKIVPVLTFEHSKIYLACNKAVPDAQIDSMNAAAAAMQRDGTMNAIDRKYESR